MKHFIIFTCLFFSFSALAETVFTARAPESKADLRQNYHYQLLDLALQKTIETHGSYRLELAAEGANMKRSMRNVQQNRYQNYFLRQSVSTELMEKMEPVPFPVDRGIVGYRVAFTSVETKERLKSIKTISDLKKFSIVQGIGWLDTRILKSQGFTVETSSSYESMFVMVARDRADLFTRGANELLGEWQNHKNIPNLTYDESIVLYYPLPRFFFTTKGNKESAERVYSGLIKAYKDGSLIQLWQKNYAPSIAFTKLGKRKIFSVTNPLIEDLDSSYTKYLYNPFTE